MSMQGTRAKLPTKKAMNAFAEPEEFGNKLKLPESIAKELEKKDLVHRFVSIRRIQESGNQHDKGWQVYQLDNGIPNPIDGNVDKIYRVGDLVLAVKTKAAHQRHVEYLQNRANAQKKVVAQNKREIRDKIREQQAGKYISIHDGYEENE